jgi:hypothetical protein
MSKLPRGITEWTTTEGVSVVRLHYTADPEKRTTEWLEQAKRGMPEADFRREYELSWFSKSGAAVYPDFKFERHVAQSTLHPLQGRVVARGWDFGRTPACISTQFSPLGQWCLQKEWVTTDEGIRSFGDRVVRECSLWYPDYTFVDYVDPSGFYKGQNDEQTCISILREFGVHCRPGKQDVPTRIDVITQQLLGTVDGELPRLIISPNCTMLISGFAGGYQYETLRTGRVKEAPKQNETAHIHSALQYVGTGLFKRTSKKQEPSNQKMPDMSVIYGR